MFHNYFKFNIVMLLCSFGILSGCISSIGFHTPVFSGIHESTLTPEYLLKVNQKLTPFIEDNSLDKNLYVLVLIGLGDNGEIVSSRIEKSSGSNLLDSTILKSLAQMKYFPQLIGGGYPTKPLKLSIGINGVKNGPIGVSISNTPVIFTPNPDSYYSRSAKLAGEQGNVDMTLIVNESGNVEEVLLMKSSGFPRIDNAGIELGRDYKFKPYFVNGIPTRTMVRILVKFRLGPIPYDPSNPYKPANQINSPLKLLDANSL